MGVDSPEQVRTSAGAVFLSYASEDSAAAERISTSLRAAGIEVWFDQSELRGGEAWDRQIRRRIHDCALFVPVISANTHARIEGYFRLEWKLAIDRSHLMAPDQTFLLPIAIDDTPESDERIPDRFREVQWSRLPRGETSAAFIERVRRLLTAEESPKPSSAAPVGRLSSATSVGRSTHPRRLRARTGWMAVGLAVLGAGYFLMMKGPRPGPVAALTSPVSTASPGLPAKVTEKSIAVLPFTDLSEKKDQEYFADGMAAELLDLLAKIPGLKVIGRTSSFQFKGGNQDLRTIGNTLGAVYVVEGTVRKSGDRVRVTAQLIDARDGTQRWSSSYDRMSADVLGVQDAIAANLARALQLTVTNDFGSRASVANAEAYDSYLRGLDALDQASQESVDQAAGDFQRTLDLDPQFAPAALGLAKVYQTKGEEGWLLPTRAAFERARAAADMAIRLDPKLAAAHAVRANVLVMYDWDWAGADREIKEATSLGRPVEVILAAARLAAVRNEWDEATHLLQTGLAADPLNSDLHLVLGWGVELRSGRFASAESSIRRALEISPNFGSGNWFLGLTLLFQDRLPEALAAMQRETAYDGQLVGTAIVYHALGRKAESDAALKRAIEQNSEEWPSAIARAYAFRGERDQAMKWLERAYSVRDEDLYFIRNDPLMKNLEGDSRYVAFLRKMNLPE